MAGHGTPTLPQKTLPTGTRIAVITASWHRQALDHMREHAAKTLTEAGATVQHYNVPGAFELPLAAAQLLHPHTETSKHPDTPPYAAAVCLGVIVRGGTPHFDYVCDAVTQGLTRVQLDTQKPVGFGVLTVDTPQQALDRSGAPGAPESKGREAAEAVIAMLGFHA